MAETRINQRFRTIMRTTREQHGWSQGEMSRRLVLNGMARLGHQTTIVRIENGERPVKLDEAAAIATLLGLDLQDMTADPDTHRIRTAVATTNDQRAELSRAGSLYFEFQLALRWAVEEHAAAVDEAELAPARGLLAETPGDAAMSGIRQAMADLGIEDYDAFRELRNQQALDIRGRATRRQEDDDA